MPDLALTHALLFEATGAEPVADATVLISDGRIVAAGSDVSVPDGTDVRDLQGQTVLPGLIDAHVHLGGLGFGNRPAFAGAVATDDYAAARTGALRHGVTTQRSLGDFLADALRVREEIAAGVLRGPRILTSGPSFQVEGGHPNGSVWFNDPVALREAARVPKTLDEARRAVDDLAAAGVDLIKIIISNNAVFGPARPELKMPWDRTAAIIDAAHAAGLRVAAHTEELDDCLRAVQLGADDIEHLAMHAPQGLDDNAFDALFDLMVTQGTYLVPTMAAHQHAATPDTDPRTLHNGNFLVKRAFDRGVTIGVGSDAHSVGLHGWALRNEIVMLVHDQGIPAAAVLTAATSTNAELLGISDHVGTIEPGKIADLLVVGGNPLQDITTIADVRLVIQGGVIVDTTN